jgi:eukaryotic-like serine/threonine-protein kinase
MPYRSVSLRLLPGDVLGAFEVVGFIAEGGMGAVYHAKNRLTGEPRAIKVILPALAARKDFVERFLREVTLAASVDHPNLVRVFEPATHGDTIILPMELLEGEALDARLRRTGPLAPDEVIRLLLPLCSAVSAVHARGIVHRDLKPSNCFLARQRGAIVPKVLDFGAARLIDRADDENTPHGNVVGTPFYMAPEQAEGRRDLDGAVDQYALGVIAYQLLTGKRPYENDDDGHALMKCIRGVAYPRPRALDPTIPAPLDAVVMRALERDRTRRFPSIDAFAAALAQSCDQEVTTVGLTANDLVPVSAGSALAVTLPPPSPTDDGTTSVRAPTRPVLALAFVASTLAVLACWQVLSGPRGQLRRVVRARFTAPAQLAAPPAVTTASTLRSAPPAVAPRVMPVGVVAVAPVAAPRAVAPPSRPPRRVAVEHPPVARAPTVETHVCVPRPGVPCL